MTNWTERSNFPSDDPNAPPHNDSGWSKYQKALLESGVKNKNHRWYAYHVKRFLACFPTQNISDLTADEVLMHFRKLDPGFFKADWQHIQYIDAIRILGGETTRAK